MKKSLIKKTLSIILVLTLFLSLFITNSYASTNHLSASDDEVKKLTWEEKMDEKIIKKFEFINDDDRITVGIWFSDIDHSAIKTKVKNQTGLSEKDLNILHKDGASRKLINELQKASNTNPNQKQKTKISKLIKEYLNDTKSQRQQEKDLSKEFSSAERKIYSSMYANNNKRIINNLNIKDDEIEFQSCLTPSAIINVSKKEIVEIAKSKQVKRINYIEEVDEEDPTQAENKSIMKIDKVYENFGLTGDDINVLMNERNFVRSDIYNYSKITNTSSIRNIFNLQEYLTTNTSVLPNDDYFHANEMAYVLHDYSANTNIFSTIKYKYADMEWAIINRNIDVINASTNYETPTLYENSYSAQWFDTVVSTYSIPLIASAGNEAKDGNNYNLLSPACGYNSIAVGVYDIHTNKMKDYRYAPTNGSLLPCYKPDLIVAADYTSPGSPTLTAITSMILECIPSLKREPEIIKAILMASCHRKVLPYGTDAPESITDGLTMKQGSGVADAYKALTIALQGTYEKGTISSGSNSSLPINIGKDNSVNVSLAWMRNNSRLTNSPASTHPLLGQIQELKLDVLCDNELMGTSERLNSYKQMVYFTNNNENSNEYTVRVTKTSGNSESTTYAYAWSTKDNYVTLHTDNSSGNLTRSEIASQLSSAGIISGDSSEPFYVDFDDSVSIIGYQAFRWYNNLAGVDLSGITKIENGAFRDCSSLTEVEIPSGLLTIEDNAFRNCSSLSKVIIGDSVRSIGENAFYNCSSLSNVKFLKYIAPTIRDNAFSGIANNAKGYITPLAVGYANSYDDLEIVHNTNIKTIYFTNNKNWNYLYAYVWNGNVSYYNQTIPLQYSYMNHYGQNVYSLTVDTNQYDMVRFIGDNGNHRTVEIEIGANGIEYYTTSGNANNEYNVSTYMPDVRTIYFTNNNNWTDVRAYLWKAGTSQNNIWHGLPMTYSYTNGYSQDVYSINLDYNEYDCVVFNDFNSNNQTVDINIGSSGIGYYLTGNKVGNKWMVGTFYN